MGRRAFLLRPSAYMQALREFDPTNGFSVAPTPVGRSENPYPSPGSAETATSGDLNSPLLSLCVFLAPVAGSGQEYKDGQFYKTPRTQEPNSCAITVHGVIMMESTNITTR